MSLRKTLLAATVLSLPIAAQAQPATGFLPVAAQAQPVNGLYIGAAAGEALSGIDLGPEAKRALRRGHAASAQGAAR